MALQTSYFPTTNAQSSTVVADDQDATSFRIISEKAPYAGTNIKDSYRNAYTVFTSTDSLKAIWTLPVANNTSYCISISLPKNQLFLPTQNYKIYDGKDGGKLLAEVSANQALYASQEKSVLPSGCAQGREVSNVSWVDTGTIVKSTTGFIRVEYTSGVSAAVKSYVVLDAVEARPASGGTLCGNGKLEGGEQ